MRTAIVISTAALAAFLLTNEASAASRTNAANRSHRVAANRDRPAASEAISEANAFWAKILTRCGDTLYYRGLTFDVSDDPKAPKQDDQDVWLFKGARFAADFPSVSDADRMNGLQDDGQIGILPHIYKEGSEAWRDGPDSHNVLDASDKDLIHYPTGLPKFHLWKQNGVWYVVETSAAGDLGSRYEVQKLLDDEQITHSCGSEAPENVSDPKAISR